MNKSNSFGHNDRRRSSVIRSPLYGLISLDFLVMGDPHECPYLPGRIAREEAFRASDFPPDLYHDFMDHGFRRSGHLFYRPACEQCSECRALRIPVLRYKPKKSQRRILNKNRDIVVSIDSPRLSAEKHRIYADYLAVQHRSSQENSADDLYRFLYCSPVNTVELVYRLLDRIVAVGIADLSSRSLSSVYVYFDPEFSYRSLGTFSVLKELMICRDLGVPHYYMGFLVADCSSMSYKARFEPCEILDPSFVWQPYPAATSSRSPN
ncbi:MAG: arginyltransferase [Desulfomonilaceae bacterium]|nr:arginyltransferase [Desulfomonilaceae bacterium]